MVKNYFFKSTHSHLLCEAEMPMYDSNSLKLNCGYLTNK